jgi:HPt (histidine-containing phosphotransfer) domain-containing protein
MGPTADAAALTDSATDAPPRAPLDAIDLAHLARMTLGERGLEAEVLSLFERQAAVLLAHMGDGAPATVAAFAHTLKGSARGIGAWRIAEAADAVEKKAARSNAREVASAVARLAAAVDEAKVVIADRLRPHTALQLEERRADR